MLPVSWVVLVGAAWVGCSNEAPSRRTVAPGTETEALLGPRIRRLTNAEYDATVQALLGTKQAPAARFVPDARLYKHGKFERNEAQIVEPALARQLKQAAESLATEYVAEALDDALPCVNQGDAACARLFFEQFLPRAYRRAVSVPELEQLLSVVVEPALARDGFRSAIALGIEATLQSSAFLYHTELGEEALAEGPFVLASSEIAQAMAYLLTGAPADAELLVADLMLPENRDLHARRLLQLPSARVQVRTMVKQWLEIDQAADTRKSLTKFPEYQPHTFDKESDDFIDEVVFARNGGFTLLMGADFTVGSAELATLYGAPVPTSSPGIIDLTGVRRRGISNLGAFVATYATPEYPSPVRRGARFLTQALCVDPGDPNALLLRVELPPLDSTKTTRQRFEQHNQAACAGCHAMIDSVGFTFQHFNAAGVWEANEDGNPELPIDSATSLSLPSEIVFGAEPVADSAELATLTSESDEGRRCFARNLARFSTASYGAELERGFIDEWQRLAAVGQDSVQELLVAFVRSELFVLRDAARNEAGE
jgi:hypothetical protein